MSDSGSPFIVRMRNVRRAFEGREVLGGIDLDLTPGEFVAILGPSGCGKSTLLRVLAALDPYAAGEITVPARRAVVFQEPRLLPWKKVGRNVSLGLACSPAVAKQRALRALEEVGLAERSNAWPLTLSGGEAQRVALARALVREPELLLLDEPFGALDALTRIRMHALLAELWRRHLPAVLLVTHDVDEVLLLADRAVVLCCPGAIEDSRDGASATRGATIIADMPIDLPRPRRRRDPRFTELRRVLLGHLGVQDDDQPASEPRGTLLATGEDNHDEAKVASGLLARATRPELISPSSPS